MTDPTRPVTRNTPRPPSQQIADYLRQDIIGGVYPDGTPLPSESAIAATYGVQRKTARKAVRVLVGEGRANVVRGQGAYAIHPPADGDSTAERAS